MSLPNHISAISGDVIGNNFVNYYGYRIDANIFNNLTYAQKYTLANNKNGLNPPIPILEYHNIGDGINSYYYTNISQFIKQMAFLSSKNFHTITDKQLFDYLNGIGTLPSNPIMIIFDNAPVNTLTITAPIMSTYGFTGVTAVFPSVIGVESIYMTYNNISSLIQNYGWSVISHSYVHCLMDSSTPAGTNEAICNTTITRESNFSMSKTALQDNLGININTFLFPFDHWGINNNEHVIIMSECLKYYNLCIGGVSTTTSPIYVTKNSSITGYGLTRIEISNDTTMSGFNNALNFDVSGIVNNNSYDNMIILGLYLSIIGVIIIAGFTSFILRKIRRNENWKRRK